jgi:hypothetical protein
MLNNGSSVIQPYGNTSNATLRLSQNMNPLDPAATQQLMGPMGNSSNNQQAPSGQVLPKPILDRDGVIHPEAALAMGDQQLYGILALAKSNQRDAEGKGAWTRGTMGAVAGTAVGLLVLAALPGGFTLMPALIAGGVGALGGGIVGAQEGAYIARNEYVARDLAVDGSLNGIFLQG